MTDIQDLRAAAFGFTPEKAGTAYERLAAVVLAVLGWRRVEHDRAQSGDGRRIEHPIDVTARDPHGEFERLIVECKHWRTTVGTGTVDRSPACARLPASLRPLQPGSVRRRDGSRA